ncbi:metallophosphoesterase [Mycolicibacterium sp. F2034L]|uniref:metallophosphoesterase n=1 Tax=Mycolicibacterium sp. F2034L TaxID=2926422 RepID=UPI001FF2BE44|nr:metallophosphoesterase [Mycolicibacterium sp. F2034L]MCK0176927.1 metallophosphoesterase [Mycolicibacterium sp. F2034L]
MFIIVLTAILVLIHLYLWKRLVKDTTYRGPLRRALTAVLLGLAALLVAALIVPRLTDTQESAWLAWPGYLWFGLAAYLFLTLLVLEPVRLVLRRWTRRSPPPAPEPPETLETPADPAVNRRIFLARAGAAAAGAASVGLAFNGFRIAVVSDVHLGPLAGRAHTERIVRMINETEPDLVAIVGDLVDGTVAELGAAAEPLQDLVARDGAFFVTGNHEYFVPDTAEWLRELERLDVHPLRNENTDITRAGARFTLAGVNDLAGEQRSDPPDFDRALAGRRDDAPTVLLAHQPIQVGEAARRGVDLQLSGHTHGGQMWPFHYAVRAVQPALAGLSRVPGADDTQLYVTRGAGFWGPPIRIGAPPDITVLSLQNDG